LNILFWHMYCRSAFSVWSDCSQRLGEEQAPRTRDCLGKKYLQL
jgi:hypothetical protein